MTQDSSRAPTAPQAPLNLTIVSEAEGLKPPDHFLVSLSDTDMRRGALMNGDYVKLRTRRADSVAIARRDPGMPAGSVRIAASALLNLRCADPRIQALRSFPTSVQ